MNKKSIVLFLFERNEQRKINNFHVFRGDETKGSEREEKER